MICRQKEKGFGLIAAIFLLVGFSMIGGYMLSLSATQQANIASSIEGIRAYYAARSGLYWMITQTTINDTIDPIDPIIGRAEHDALCDTVAGGGVGTTTFDISGDAGSAINGFKITVLCDDLNVAGFREGNTNAYELDKMTITAERIGRSYPNDFYISRKISATIRGRNLP